MQLVLYKIKLTDFPLPKTFDHFFDFVVQKIHVTDENTVFFKKKKHCSKSHNLVFNNFGNSFCTVKINFSPQIESIFRMKLDHRILDTFKWMQNAITQSLESKNVVLRQLQQRIPFFLTITTQHVTPSQDGPPTLKQMPPPFSSYSGLQS